METKIPIVACQGFVRLPYEAQVLWFHMSARTDDKGCMSAQDAAELRKALEIGDGAVRELIRNKFIVMIDDHTIHVEENETYHGLVTAGNGEDVVSRVMFGRVIWCTPISRYYEAMYGRRWNQMGGAGIG